MADLNFNTPAGQTIDRELLILCLNTGTDSAPTWSPVGKRVADSSAEYDWSDESEQDILGDVHGSMRKPVITQGFDPYPLDAGDPVAVKLWNLAIKDQDVQALSSQDVLIIHDYVTSGNASWAERYDSSMVKVTSIGGEGGGRIEIATEVTYGGTRTTGKATKNAETGAITFTAD